MTTPTNNQPPPEVQHVWSEPYEFWRTLICLRCGFVRTYGDLIAGTEIPQCKPAPAEAKRCTCWLGTGATGGDSKQREQCFVHGLKPPPAEVQPAMLATEKVFAPWTRDQVQSLNGYQQDGRFHPFTCTCGATLLADVDGWRCQLCSYTQNWAWSFMADGSWRGLKPPPDNAGAAREDDEIELEWPKPVVTRTLDCVPKERMTELLDREQECLKLRQRVGELEEWKRNIFGLLIHYDIRNKMSNWGGDISGWGACFEYINWHFKRAREVDTLARAIDPSGRTTDVRQLVERVEGMREALEFYADDANWKLKAMNVTPASERGPEEVGYHSAEVLEDEGEIARAALAGLERVEELRRKAGE